MLKIIDIKENYDLFLRAYAYVILKLDIKMFIL